MRHVKKKIFTTIGTTARETGQLYQCLSELMRLTPLDSGIASKVTNVEYNSYHYVCTYNNELKIETIGPNGGCYSSDYFPYKLFNGLYSSRNAAATNWEPLNDTASCEATSLMLYFLDNAIKPTSYRLYQGHATGSYYASSWDIYGYERLDDGDDKAILIESRRKLSSAECALSLVSFNVSYPTDTPLRKLKFTFRDYGTTHFTMGQLEIYGHKHLLLPES